MLDEAWACTASAYDAAMAGGAYDKFLAERVKHTDAQLRKSARSYERTIAQHEAWIADPYLKVPRDTSLVSIERYVSEKWPSDIRRNKAYLDIVEEILGSRK